MKFENFYRQLVYQAKDILFEPITVRLAKLGVIPDFLTAMSFILTAIFAYTLGNSLFVSVFLIMFAILFDALDGSLARKIGKFSKYGSFLDFFVDNLGLFVVCFFLLLKGYVNSFWMILFIVNYFIVLMVYRFYSMKAFEVFRSRLLLYFFLLINFYFNSLVLYPFIVFFAVYMLIMNIINLIKIFGNGRHS